MKSLVNEEAFRIYLVRTLSKERLVIDCVSRCRRVNRWEGNLLEHYSRDHGKSLLDRLSYSKMDAEQSTEPKHSIIFDGGKGFQTVWEGTTSLRNAVLHYFEFLRQHNL